MNPSKLYRNFFKYGIGLAKTAKFEERIASTCTLYRGFHGTSSLYKRKSGASAFNPVARVFSKKQKKRKKRLVDRLKLKVDHAKQSLKFKQIDKQWDNPKTQELIVKQREMIANSINQMLVPEGIAHPELSLSDEPRKQKPVFFPPNPHRILLLLQDYKSKVLEVQQQQQQQPTFESTSSLPLSSTTSRDNISITNSSNNNHNFVITSTNDFEYDSSVHNPIEPLANILPDRYLSRWRIGAAAVEFAKMRRFDKTKELMQLMKFVKVEPTLEQYNLLMKYSITAKRYNEAEGYINEMMSSDSPTLAPNEITWDSLIQVKLYQNPFERAQGIKDATAILDRLLSLGGVVTSVNFFNTIFKAIVEKNDKQEVMKFWLRMHSIPNIKLDLHSFIIYMRHCSLTGQVERAFFSVDEMKSLKIEPTVEFYTSLFRVCAEAPFWVNGYQNIIFDAMRSMEGKELLPDKEVYNAVIYAFGRSCDAAAAEFYFWEMRNKGLPQDVKTYNSLLNGLARAQTIGIKYYGSKGRFTRRPDNELTEDQQAAVDLGPKRTAELMSSGIYIEEPPNITVRGKTGKMRGNIKHDHLIDLIDDNEDEEAKDYFLASMRSEAKEVNKLRAIYEKQEAQKEKDEDEYFAALQSGKAQMTTNKLIAKTNLKIEFKQSRREPVALTDQAVKQYKKDKQETNNNNSSLLNQNNNNQHLLASSDDNNEVDDEEGNENDDEPSFDQQVQELQSTDIEFQTLLKQMEELASLESEEQVIAFSKKKQLQDANLAALKLQSQSSQQNSNSNNNSNSKIKRKGNNGSSNSSNRGGRGLTEKGEYSVTDKSRQDEIFGAATTTNNDKEEEEEEDEGIGDGAIETKKESSESSGRGRKISRKLPRRRRSSSSVSSRSDDDNEGEGEGEEDGEYSDINRNVNNSSKKVSSGRNMNKKTSLSSSRPPQRPYNPATNFWLENPFDRDDINVDIHFTDPFKSLRSTQRLQQDTEADFGFSDSAKNLVELLDGSNKYGKLGTGGGSGNKNTSNNNSSNAQKSSGESSLLNSVEKEKKDRSRPPKVMLTSGSSDTGSGVSSNSNDVDVDTDEYNNNNKSSSNDNVDDENENDSNNISMMDLNAMFKDLSKSDIDSMWEMVEFGRCPDADYSDPVYIRQRRNAARADLVIADMRKRGIQPDVRTLTSYMAVYAEASKVVQALAIFKEFKRFHIQPDAHTYRVLIKMFIRKKDITHALAMKNEMKNLYNIQPDAEIHGMLLQCFTHHQMIVEALHELEECTEKGLKIPERHIKYLRGRCETLGVKHPDMPANPRQWIMDVKKVRKDMRHASKRKIQIVESAKYR